MLLMARQKREGTGDCSVALQTSECIAFAAYRELHHPLSRNLHFGRSAPRPTVDRVLAAETSGIIEIQVP
jgi:hypothetical protein